MKLRFGAQLNDRPCVIDMRAIQNVFILEVQRLVRNATNDGDEMITDFIKINCDDLTKAMKFFK